MNVRKALAEKQKSPCECMGFLYIWWRIRDSNPGPADYDSVALTG